MALEPLMLAIIAIFLLVIVVLIIYLADRVNSLEKQTQDAVSSLRDKSPAFKGPFAGLASKKLWDAMTGLLPEGIDDSQVQEVRERYEAVLQKHIEVQFSEGLKDGQRGLSGDPKNTRWISTLRGQVESWLPQSQINAIYKAGLDSANAQTPEQQATVRMALEEACAQLYDKTQLERPATLSAQLLPPLATGANLDRPTTGMAVTGAESSAKPM